MRAAAPFALAALLCMAPSALAQDTILGIELNETTPLRLSGNAAGVVIGNPGVADVAVHSPNLLFVTGKSYGTTTLHVIDARGREIYSGPIQVSAPTLNRLTVLRGGDAYTMACQPECRAAPVIGDEQEYFEQGRNQIAAGTGG